jgi:hypothetical protein
MHAQYTAEFGGKQLLIGSCLLHTLQSISRAYYLHAQPLEPGFVALLWMTALAIAYIVY